MVRATGGCAHAQTPTRCPPCLSPIVFLTFWLSSSVPSEGWNRCIFFFLSSFPHSFSLNLLSVCWNHFTIWKNSSVECFFLQNLSDGRWDTEDDTLDDLCRKVTSEKIGFLCQKQLIYPKTLRLWQATCLNRKQADGTLKSDWIFY